MAKVKKGGKRAGAGRKTVSDKKVPFTVYVPGSWLRVIGVDKSRLLCISMLEGEAKKI